MQERPLPYKGIEHPSYEGDALNFWIAQCKEKDKYISLLTEQLKLREEELQYIRQHFICQGK